MNDNQLAMVRSLKWQGASFNCDLSDTLDSGYRFGSGYPYGMNNQPYAIVCRESDDAIAFIPTDKGEAFSTVEWNKKFKVAGREGIPYSEPNQIGKIKILPGVYKYDVKIESVARAIAKAQGWGLNKNAYGIEIPDESAMHFWFLARVAIAAYTEAP